jgi:Tfp pilus assembly protein PilO
MNTRTLTASVLGAVLIIGAWWMFVFSGIRSEASDVDKAIDTAKTEERALETQLSQLEALTAKAPELQAEAERLQKAVPADIDLAGFIESANARGAEAGVKWLSVSPTEPTATGTAGTIQLSISVEGDYYKVLDYLNRLEHMDRLLVVDAIDLTASDGAGSTNETTLTASLTARMFTQPQVSTPVPGSGTDASTGQES